MIGKQKRPQQLAATLGAVLTLTGGVASLVLDQSARASPPAQASTDIHGSPGQGSDSSPGHDSLGSPGHDSRALSVNDTGHLHLLKTFGSVLVEEGFAGGTLPGEAKVHLVVGTTVTASFTIQTKSGTIYGSGRAALHSSGRYASFGGSLSVSHGTGSYAHAHGVGKLYGVIDRRSSALTVQTVGTLSY